MFSLVTKKLLSLGGAVVGAGGVTGLVHAVPTIAYDTGLACQPVSVTSKDKITGPKIQWDKEGKEFSEIPWKNGIKNQNPGRCYKRA